MNAFDKQVELIKEYANTPGRTRDDLENLMVKLRKLERHPIPGWKKKLYLVTGSLLAGWVLMQYLHYEACREKYPNASAWVCMVSPK